MGLHRRHLKGRRARAARLALSLLLSLNAMRGPREVPAPKESWDANLARGRSPKCPQALVDTQTLECLNRRGD